MAGDSAWKILAQGKATGDRIAIGPGIRVGSLSALETVEHGSVIVVARPENDLVLIIDRVVGIIAESGGLLCHPALVALEFGVPYLTTLGVSCSFSDGEILRLDPFTAALAVHRDSRF